MTTQQQTFTKDILPLFEWSQPDWLEVARKTAVVIAKQHGFVTIDMVRAECPPPEGADPRIMGSVILCGKKGPFKKIGYEQSKRKACHGRPVAVFALRDAVK